MEAPICPYCEEPVQQDQMKAQAPCGNLFHTPCFLYLRPQRNGHIHECGPCFALFYPDDEEIEEVEEEALNTEQNRISNLYDTNEEFRKDIKKYVTALRGISKPKREFQKLVATKRAELQPRYTQIKAMYEGLYNTKKNEVITSNEYKVYRTADSRISRYWSMLREKYQLDNYNSLNVLAHKRGCRSIRRPRRYWHNTPSYIIRRGLRLRLPWW